MGFSLGGLFSGVAHTIKNIGRPGKWSLGDVGNLAGGLGSLGVKGLGGLSQFGNAPNIGKMNTTDFLNMAMGGGGAGGFGGAAAAAAGDARGYKQRGDQYSGQASGYADEMANNARGFKPLFQRGLQQTGDLRNSLAGTVGDFSSAAHAFNPAKTAELRSAQFDQNMQQSLDKDLGQANVGFSLRGFTPGTDSSGQRGAVADTLVRRAGDTAAAKGAIRDNAFNQKFNLLGQQSDIERGALSAIDPTRDYGAMQSGLSGAAGIKGGLAGNQYNIASGWDPTGAVATAGNLNSQGGGFDLTKLFPNLKPGTKPGDIPFTGKSGTFLPPTAGKNLKTDWLKNMHFAL